MLLEAGELLSQQPPGGYAPPNVNYTRLLMVEALGWHRQDSENQSFSKAKGIADERVVMEEGTGTTPK